MQETIGRRICAKESLQECSNRRCRALPEFKRNQQPLITQVERGQSWGRRGSSSARVGCTAGLTRNLPHSLACSTATTLPGEGSQRVTSCSAAASFPPLESWGLVQAAQSQGEGSGEQVWERPLEAAQGPFTGATKEPGRIRASLSPALFHHVHAPGSMHTGRQEIRFQP